MQPLPGLKVVNSGLAVPEKVPMTERNKDLLLKRVQDISTNLFPEKQTTSSWLDYFPGAETIGRSLGFVVGKAHGGELCNFFVGMIANRLVTPEKPTTTFWGSFCSAAVKPTFAEAAKLLITPKILPLVEVACVSLGGITVPAAALLVTMLAQRILIAENSKYTVDTLPPIEEMMRSENGNIVDANGNVIHEKDLQELKAVVQQYNLLCRLLTTDREDIDGLLLEYVKTDHRQNPRFCNGEAISGKQQKVIEKAASALKRENFAGDFNNNNKYILKTIEMLTQNYEVVKPTLTIQPSETVVEKEEKVEEELTIESFEMLTPDDEVVKPTLTIQPSETVVEKEEKVEEEPTIESFQMLTQNHELFEGEIKAPSSEK